MPLQLLNSSIVVTAESHNPTILHPLFLERERIVPEQWRLAADSVVCTPLMSALRFDNGVQMTVETTKLQVIDSSSDDSRSEEIAARYVTALPHVRYTGVG